MWKLSTIILFVIAAFTAIAAPITQNNLMIASHINYPTAQNSLNGIDDTCSYHCLMRGYSPLRCSKMC